MKKMRALRRVSLSTTHEPRPEVLCINEQRLESRDVPHAIWNSYIRWQSYVMASTSDTRPRKRSVDKSNMCLSFCPSVYPSVLSAHTRSAPTSCFNSYFKHGKADNVRSVTDTKTALLFTSSHHHRTNHPSLSSTPYYINIITVVTTPVTPSLTHQCHHYDHSRFTMIITHLLTYSMEQGPS